MKLKSPLSLIVIMVSALSTACSVAPVPPENHPIYSTVALQAQSARCLQADLVSTDVHRQIQSNAEVVRRGINVSTKNYSDRLAQLTETATADPASCEMVASNLVGLQLASAYFATYPAGRNAQSARNNFYPGPSATISIPLEAMNFSSYSNFSSHRSNGW